MTVVCNVVAVMTVICNVVAVMAALVPVVAMTLTGRRCAVMVIEAFNVTTLALKYA